MMTLFSETVQAGADCFQVPPWPGTVLPHRRLRPCVVRGWSTSAAVRRHQNPVRSTDSYCHRRHELCSGRVWDSLPPELRMLNCTMSAPGFAAKLKTFLFSAVSASENFWSRARQICTLHYITMKLQTRLQWYILAHCDQCFLRHLVCVHSVRFPEFCSQRIRIFNRNFMRSLSVLICCRKNMSY